ncbi:MAG: PAS domain-containing protein, partial [Chloroflexota bacterium]|nr:PAS domain-containing protein [Chloroflexota bacterium]
MAITRLSDGKFVEVSDNFLTVFGYSREELIGSTALELGLWADPEERAYMVRTVQEQGSVVSEVSFINKSGVMRITLFSAQQAEIGGELFL